MKNYSSEELKNITNLAVEAKSNPNKFNELYSVCQPLIIYEVNRFRGERLRGRSKLSPYKSCVYIGDEDLYQELSIALSKCLKYYNPKKNNNFVAYFYRVMRNTEAYMYRKNSKDRYLISLNDTDECGVVIMDSVKAPEKYNPAYAYDYKEILKDLEENLKREEKTVLRLLAAGLTIKEIAKKIGKHQASVYRAKNSIKKAAKKLVIGFDEVGPYRVPSSPSVFFCIKLFPLFAECRHASKRVG